MPVNPELRRQRQEEHEFEDVLCYIAKICLKKKKNYGHFSSLNFPKCLHLPKTDQGDIPSGWKWLCGFPVGEPRDGTCHRAWCELLCHRAWVSFCVTFSLQVKCQILRAAAPLPVQIQTPRQKMKSSMWLLGMLLQESGKPYDGKGVLRAT